MAHKGSSHGRVTRGRAMRGQLMRNFFALRWLTQGVLMNR